MLTNTAEDTVDVPQAGMSFVASEVNTMLLSKLKLMRIWWSPYQCLGGFSCVQGFLTPQEFISVSRACVTIGTRHHPVRISCRVPKLDLREQVGPCCAVCICGAGVTG